MEINFDSNIEQLIYSETESTRNYTFCTIPLVVSVHLGIMYDGVLICSYDEWNKSKPHQREVTLIEHLTSRLCICTTTSKDHLSRLLKSLCMMNMREVIFDPQHAMRYVNIDDIDVTKINIPMYPGKPDPG